jgi:TRAP-type C4-dicarboxylate transport system permease small subunit
MERLWRHVEKVLGGLSLLALACLVVLPFTQVVLRDFFSSPIVGLEEATRWGLIALVFLALPLLVTVNGQIRFAELVDKLPLRLRNFLERATVLLAAAALGVITWAGIGSILKNTGTRTPTLDIPFWLFALPFLVGAGITALGYLWIAIRRAHPPVGSGSETL